MTIKIAQGMFPSEKMDRPVYFKSRMQRDYLLLLEFAHEVVAYEHEPQFIEKSVPAIPVKARPDFLVAHAGQLSLVSLVNERESYKIDPDTWFADLLSSFCSEQGIAWIAVRDSELYSNHLIENLRLLHQFSRYSRHLDHALLHGIIELLSNGGQYTIAELMLHVLPDSPQKAAIPIMYLIWHQEVAANLLLERISPKSVVERSSIIFRSQELEA